MRINNQKSAIVLLAIAALTLPNTALAANCYVNDVNRNSPLTSPIQSDQEFPGGVVCGNRVEGAGCVLEIKSAGGWSSNQPCLRIGRGVKVEGEGNTLTCTEFSTPWGLHPCGAAIRVEEYSGNGTGTTEISNLTVVGCSQDGVVNYHGTVNAIASDITVNASCSGIGTTTGIGGFKTVLRANITGADSGVRMPNSGSLKDSLIRNCEIGAGGGGTGAGTTVINSILVDNGTHIARDGNSPWDTKGSVYRNATTCACSDGGTFGCANGIDNCTGFSGDTSFSDNVLK